MLLSGKRVILIGFVVSILLSLFVNFTLIMRTYEKLIKGIDTIPFAPHFVGAYLYFSLAWFFLFALILFVVTIQLYKLGDRIFRQKGYKAMLLVITVDILLAFAMIQFYPLAQQVVTEDILQSEDPKFPQKPDRTNPRQKTDPFPERRGGVPSEYIFPDMHKAPDASIPFFWPLDLRPFPRPLVTEHLFVLLTVILSVILMRLLSSKQQIALEYEQLKTEKLQTSYNALMGQINPHFFFNSLNGLNALIRSGEQEQTLTYLDELSNVFRYILQSNKKELVTLAEELQFVKAYTYLLSVRYEGKLFFSIQADTPYLLWYLPILSSHPLKSGFKFFT
ncbi:hypothetical protein M2459_002842 [Parabacteroides sp. PF5-5]|uniref:sensor histidine kinase n=1 Tax=unclassified Parabacteroides TaxID=2649774 RepID=UPI002474077D|nr:MULTISPECIES: histidine kinase [unclassified Parabacteroides]MDH6306128.1 hypothetical protein [Parabacteroides sp. PH5-39]MDH6317087.1 hypothetical protein [Parabacteroides sp. PF5-13]MDH6320840.1 hypothetical protein [Parabacteroides sp. PH5-13]MDH6324571.1 hypothetical protein [Parabacteroides sp. PH5-8]MDH6328378.1 hypothetical protein [Parabacteroides sp. PH5-41]